MRKLLFPSAVIAAALIIASPLRMQAQTEEQPAGPRGQMGGQGRRGGFGQMGQPVQGTVTAASANKLTIKTDSGDSYDITVTENSRIMEDRQPAKLTDIKLGDSVTAMGQVDDTKKTMQAMMVSAFDAATVAKAKENLGKTYITGRITAIDADNLKLTVMRTDHVSQVIQVDEGTSFQRGTRGVAADVAAAGGIAMGGGFGGGRGMGMGGGTGRRGGGEATAPTAPESITLADIKVGDTLMATGSMKNGAFTALKMGVATPGAGPGGGRRMQDQNGPGASGSQPPATPPQ